MASPEWNYGANTASSYGRKARAISGATTLDPIAKAVVMLQAGDITVTVGGTSLAFVGLPAGYIIPFQCSAANASAGVAATID